MTDDYRSRILTPDDSKITYVKESAVTPRIAYYTVVEARETE